MICTGLILLGILTGLGIFFLKWNRHRILTENLELAEQFLLDEDYVFAKEYAPNMLHFLPPLVVFCIGQIFVITSPCNKTKRFHNNT